MFSIAVSLTNGDDTDDRDGDGDGDDLPRRVFRCRQVGGVGRNVGEIPLVEQPKVGRGEVVEPILICHKDNDNCKMKLTVKWQDVIVVTRDNDIRNRRRGISMKF